MMSKLKKLSLVFIVMLGLIPANVKAMDLPLPPVAERHIDSLKQQATQGDINAQKELAKLYLRGFVLAFCDNPPDGLDIPSATGKVSCPKKQISPDYIQAFKYFKEAADAGDAWAQTYVGWFYDQGKVVSQDYTAALKWYNLAADQGYPPAQDLLGRVYRDGHGAAVNYSLAAEFFEKATRQYYASSNIHLSRLYFTGGPGLPQNYEKAFFWLNLKENSAFSPRVGWRADELCCENEDAAYYNNKEVEKHLTPAQIEKIKKQVMDYKMPPRTNWLALPARPIPSTPSIPPLSSQTPSQPNNLQR
jgi:hypothetical protein